VTPPQGDLTRPTPQRMRTGRDAQRDEGGFGGGSKSWRKLCWIYGDRIAYPLVLVLDGQARLRGAWVERPAELAAWIDARRGVVPDPELGLNRLGWYAGNRGRADAPYRSPTPRAPRLSVLPKPASDLLSRLGVRPPACLQRAGRAVPQLDAQIVRPQPRPGHERLGP
jgi:hypothetical protein